MHGRGDLAGVATGFGLRGSTLQDMGRMESLFAEHQAANNASLWDVTHRRPDRLAQLPPGALRRGLSALP